MTYGRLFLAIALVVPGLGFSSEAESTARVTGSVYALADVRMVVPGTAVVFKSDGEPPVKTTTNQLGKYEVTLEAGRDYTVAVTKAGFCPVDRPAFRPKAGSTLKFDFTTAVCPYIYLIRVPETPFVETCSTPVLTDYRNEDTVALGGLQARRLIIAFGSRKCEGSWARYYAVPIPTNPEDHLPVTISFDTYTVHADTAVMDRKTRALKAEGNVSVYDGSEAPPRKASCVMLRLSDASPQIETCDAKEK